MYPTVEVRWFFKGEIPENVWTDYFNAGNPPTLFPQRTDQYLVIPDHEGLGIKLREGFLEIKQRTETHGIYQFNPRTVGMVEAWRKWNFALAYAEHESPDSLLQLSTEGWVGVVKKRWLRRYLLVKGDKATEISHETEVENGCEWELSSIRLENNESQWWSIAFEAFGNPNYLLTNVKTVVEQVFSGIGGMSFQTGDSFSYPAFLNKYYA